MAATCIQTGEFVTRYLRRIGIDAVRPADEGFMSDLQYMHLTHVPYENLDILAGRPLKLDHESLFDKLVTRRRGGFCFEQNELFGELLRRLGFLVTDHFSRFLRDAEDIPKRRHHVLIVRIPGGRARYLCDAGVGSGSPIRPVRMEEGVEQQIGGVRYKFGKDAFLGWVLFEFRKEEWRRLLSFTEEEQSPVDFVTTSFYCEYAEDSDFNKGAMVLLRTKDGRRTIDRQKFKVFSGDNVRVEEIKSPGEMALLLYRRFGLSGFSADAIRDIWRGNF